jgi:hypothetical protein
MSFLLGQGRNLGRNLLLSSIMAGRTARSKCSPVRPSESPTPTQMTVRAVREDASMGTCYSDLGHRLFATHVWCLNGIIVELPRRPDCPGGGQGVSSLYGDSGRTRRCGIGRLVAGRVGRRCERAVAKMWRGSSGTRRARTRSTGRGGQPPGRRLTARTPGAWPGPAHSPLPI